MKQLIEENLQSVYGDPPHELVERIHDTLAGLPERSASSHPGRRRWTLAMTAAVISALVLSVAVAVTVGSGLVLRMGLPESADSLVVTPAPEKAEEISAVTDMVVFTVDEYLFDGISLIADIRATPTQDGVWVLPYFSETFFDQWVGNLGLVDSRMTIREYAASIGIDRLRIVQITGDTTLPESGPLNLNRYAYLDSDGLIHFLLSSSPLHETQETLDVSLHFKVQGGGMPREDTITLHLTADDRHEKLTAHLEEPIEALGVTIDRIEATRTPVATYLRIPFAYAAETAREGVQVMPAFLKSDGKMADSKLWFGTTYDVNSQTGVMEGILPPEAIQGDSFTFQIQIRRDFSDPFTVTMVRDEN